MGRALDLMETDEVERMRARAHTQSECVGSLSVQPVTCSGT